MNGDFRRGEFPNSRKYEHEEFRKKFWKFKQHHPDLVKGFTRILIEEVERMISPNGN